MKTPKRQKTAGEKLPSPALNGVLYVVATPLGNLADASPRVIETLSQVDAILCEDTRRTRALLAGLGIAPPALERFDAHLEQRAAEAVVGRLLAGASLALVSDAGTPGVSDPGARLAGLAWEAGVRVVPIAGPSAVTAAISASGWTGSGFSFFGFLPRSSRERREEFTRFLSSVHSPSIGVWFESPERVERALEDLAESVPLMSVVAFKELSKVHERAFRGTAQEVLFAAREAEAVDAKVWSGEWVLVLSSHAARDSAQNSAGSSDAWALALECCLEAGIQPSSAAKIVSQKFAVSKNEVYQLALERSGKKNLPGG